MVGEALGTSLYIFAFASYSEPECACFQSINSQPIPLASYLVAGEHFTHKQAIRTLLLRHAHKILQQLKPQGLAFLRVKLAGEDALLLY